MGKTYTLRMRIGRSGSTVGVGGGGGVNTRIESSDGQ